MALTLGNGTITFSDSTVQNTAAFIAGTRVPFGQAAAPTGWVQITTFSNHMLRFVAGAGGGSGGIHSPILNNVVPAHTHGFGTGGSSANHTHYDSGHVHQVPGNGDSGLNTDNLCAGDITSTDFHTITTISYANLGGVSADHSHSGSTDNGSSQTNWSPQYVDMILCIKS